MDKANDAGMIIYSDGELELSISIDTDTLWLTQAQLCDIFEKDQSVISRHINNIFRDNEVDKKSNMQKMHIANSDKPVSFGNFRKTKEKMKLSDILIWIKYDT